MDTDVRSYLFLRNLYSLFSMLISSTILLGLAIYVYSFVTEVFGPSIFILVVFAPIVIFGRDMLKDLRTYFRPSKYAIEPLTEPQQSRVKSLTKPILAKCHLNHHPIHYLQAEEDDETGVIMQHDSAYLTIDEEILSRPDDELQSILAHEIIHILFSDGLRAIFLNTIMILLVIYSVAVIPILLYTMTQVPWYIIIVGIAISVRFFTSWPVKISEITADTGATILGYGPGLQDFFAYTPHKQEFFIWLFDNHESKSKRMSRISKAMKRLR